MADKIDQLKIGTTSYDIDLPPDAAPSIASLTTSGNVAVGGALTKGGKPVATEDYVDDKIDALPKPMVFKGTLGTGGTITSLPTAAAANEGFTYKVITAGTYASQAAKVGDVFVSNGSAWVLIPAGDTDSDTWRAVKVNGTQLLGSAISTGAINFKNGSNVTISGSGNDITIASSYTDTNQKVKAGSITFGNNDVVDIVAGSNVTVTGLASGTGAPKITVSATDTGATSIEATGSGNVVSSASYDASTRKITLTKGVTALTAESDTLATVTGRGATTSTQSTFNGGIKLSYDSSAYNTKGLIFTNTSNQEGRIGFNSSGDFGIYAANGFYMRPGADGTTGSYGLRMTTTDYSPTANESMSLGTSTYQYNDIRGKTIYENGTSLTNKYQAKDADLTAIAGLTGTSGLLKKTAANTWTLDTNTYLTTAGTAADSSKLNGQEASYYQKALPTTTTAGKVLKSTSTAGTVQWADDTNTNQTVKGNGTAFGSNDAIDIVGAGTVTVTADTTNKKITITGSAHPTDHNQTVKGNGTAFGADAAINIVGGGATTVTADTTNNKITISTPSVTDTNQKVKAGSVTFDANDVVNFEGSGIVSVTGDATNDKITISASHQSIKTLNTTNTASQSTSSSEAISGSGTINLHKIAKTGNYNDLLNKPNPITPITWSSLKSLRNTSQLVPGTWYRITDYTCTTVQENSSSAGHAFDILVLATDINKISEEARAIQHTGDTYFTSKKLEAWKIWYCLDNDTNRFAWADSTNGKGVIYRMIDENNNDLPYDFKNILFAKESSIKFIHPGPGLQTLIRYADGDITNYWAWKNNNFTYYTQSETPSVGDLLYTSSGSSSGFTITAVTEGYSARYTFNNSNDNYSDYSMGNAVKNNIIKPYGTTSGIRYVQNLNVNVFNGLGTSTSLNRFNDNFIGENSHDNIISYDFLQNKIEAGFSNNVIGSFCKGNYIGTYFTDNKIANYFCYNTVGSSCKDIIINKQWQYGVFGAGVNNIQVIDSSSGSVGTCSFNTIDSGCAYLILTIMNTGGQINNVHIHKNVRGTSSNKITLNIRPTSANCEVNYYKDSNDNVVKSTNGNPVVYTSAPTADNYDTDYRIVLLDSEPSTKYDGYIYIIKAS